MTTASTTISISSTPTTVDLTSVIDGLNFLITDLGSMTATVNRIDTNTGTIESNTHDLINQSRDLQRISGEVLRILNDWTARGIPGGVPPATLDRITRTLDLIKKTTDYMARTNPKMSQIQDAIDNTQLNIRQWVSREVHQASADVQSRINDLNRDLDAHYNSMMKELQFIQGQLRQGILDINTNISAVNNIVANQVIPIIQRLEGRATLTNTDLNPLIISLASIEAQIRSIPTGLTRKNQIFLQEHFQSVLNAIEALPKSPGVSEIKAVITTITHDIQAKIAVQFDGIKDQIIDGLKANTSRLDELLKVTKEGFTQMNESFKGVVDSVAAVAKDLEFIKGRVESTTIVDLGKVNEHMAALDAKMTDLTREVHKALDKKQNAGLTPATKKFITDSMNTLLEAIQKIPHEPGEDSKDIEFHVHQTLSNINNIPSVSDEIMDAKVLRLLQQNSQAMTRIADELGAKIDTLSKRQDTGFQQMADKLQEMATQLDQLAGLKDLNAGFEVLRKENEELKALLTNSKKLGPHSIRGLQEALTSMRLAAQKANDNSDAQLTQSTINTINTINSTLSVLSTLTPADGFEIANMNTLVHEINRSSVEFQRRIQERLANATPQQVKSKAFQEAIHHETQIELELEEHFSQLKDTLANMRSHDFSSQIALLRNYAGELEKVEQYQLRFKSKAMVQSVSAIFQQNHDLITNLETAGIKIGDLRSELAPTGKERLLAKFTRHHSIKQECDEEVEDLKRFKEDMIKEYQMIKKFIYQDKRSDSVELGSMSQYIEQIEAMMTQRKALLDKMDSVILSYDQLANSPISGMGVSLPPLKEFHSIQSSIDKLVAHHDYWTAIKAVKAVVNSIITHYELIMPISQKIDALHSEILILDQKIKNLMANPVMAAKLHAQP